MSLTKWLTAFMLVSSIVGNICQWNQSSQYKKQLQPEVNCYYKFFSSNYTYKFYIKNIGLTDVNNVWIKERIFIVTDDQIYDGIDVPHFNFFVYKGSKDRMFDLGKSGCEKSILIDKLQKTAFNQLMQRFNAKIVSSWEIAFTKDNGEKIYRFTKNFIYDHSDFNFKTLEDYIGGGAISRKIRDYCSEGSKKEIRIFDLTGCFEIEPPSAYIIKSDYTFLPLDPWVKVSLDDLNDSIYTLLGRLDIQPSDDQTEGNLSYNWTYKNMRWTRHAIVGPKSYFYTKPLAMPFFYLNNEDKEKCIADNTLLKTGISNNRSEEIEKILKKASAKLKK